MTTVIEAVYEDGVLKPLAPSDLKEQQRYRLILQEVTPEEPPLDPELAAEIGRRTTILPDGRRIINLDGLFQADLSNIPDDRDPVAEALEELRQERARHFDEQWPELPQEPPKQ